MSQYSFINLLVLFLSRDINLSLAALIWMITYVLLRLIFEMFLQRINGQLFRFLLDAVIIINCSKLVQIDEVFE